MERTKTSDKAAPRLGRGLSALIPPQGLSLGAGVVPRPTPPDAPQASGVQDIALADIRANEWQPRTQFDDAALDELTASIKAYGVLQPVMVRPGDNGRYELVAGERRFRASERAGLKTIPAVVRPLTDEESLTVALIENIQREDLNPMEAARGYKQLTEEFGLTQAQLGQQIGKKQSTISNTMRLLSLPDEVQVSIANGDISADHGAALLAVKDYERIIKIWKRVVEQSLSVRQTRLLTGADKKASSVSAAPSRSPALDKDWAAYADMIRNALHLRVLVKADDTGAGSVTIRFANTEEANLILDRIG